MKSTFATLLAIICFSAPLPLKAKAENFSNGTIAAKISHNTYNIYCKQKSQYN